MSLDQRLSAAAREVAGGVVPPDVDLGAVRARVRADRRRTTALAASAVILAVVVGAALVDNRTSSAPPPVAPTPTPSPSVTPSEAAPAWTPDSVTPQEIVGAKDAKVLAVGVGRDLDTRLAIWSSGGSTAVAVTADGYRTTTATSLPGLDRAVEVRSVTDGLFLLTDVNDTQEWLVGVDGAPRPVTRVQGEVVATDERLWFQCATGTGWRSTWCALDPQTGRAHRWPDAWDGSAIPPRPGAVPWGANPEPRAVGNTGQLEVWWGAGAARQVRTLGAAQHGDYVLDCPGDLMALWGKASGSSAIDLYTSRDGGATWRTTSYDAPSADQWWKVRCAPDGSFLAVDSERGTTVWRTEGEAFREVFTAPGSPGSIGLAEMWTYDGRVHVSGEGTGAVSDDSGRTWTTVRTWR